VFELSTAVVKVDQVRRRPLQNRTAFFINFSETDSCQKLHNCVYIW